ncbi:MAG: hotdog domain-containing protein, partial [Alloalcanivorax xenomutans]
MSEPFRYRLRVRYSECDAQHVVFNARYGDYVDLAMTEFMRALGRDYGALLARGLDNQVVKLTLEWKASARFDDVLEI